MEKLTREQAVSLHRKMWNWIADETERTRTIINKYEYFKAMGITYSYDIPDYACYCCEYAIQQNNEEYENRCKCCPLDWGSDCDEYMCLDKKFMGYYDGLFERWNLATSIYDIEESIELAREIANLRER
ncbi:MAG: hypothetical protein ACLTBR_03240 [Anaerostipes sp.]|uniref:hypothetical protein n=1 Tax=Anaerostipes sp. TaxID=1872530 RepID=UPI003993E8B0